MRAEHYRRRQEEVQSWKVTITSYKLGDRYHCTVENVDPGARIARDEGATREEAEAKALEKAAKSLAQTRRFTPNSSS